ncbi:MAG TPA: hypothetical protein VM513_06405 [Kofleriaceae bacterium]|nr:hypothetical protein [Kofleriaceae bacterium]
MLAGARGRRIQPRAADGAAHSALLVDTAGALHGSYTAAGDVRFATKPAGGAWSHTTVDPFADGAGFSALARDAASTLHIVYTVTTGGELKHAERCAP